MITFKFLRSSLVVSIPHTINWLVIDIILNITSQEHLMLTLIHIGSRLFELFSEEVRVTKQPGKPLSSEYDCAHVSQFPQSEIELMNFFKLNICVSLSLHSFCGTLEGWNPVNQFNYTNWMTVVISTDHPQSVCNHCVVQVLAASLFCLLTLIFWWYGGFCHRTAPDLVPLLFESHLYSPIWLYHISAFV